MSGLASRERSGCRRYVAVDTIADGVADIINTEINDIADIGVNSCIQETIPPFTLQPPGLKSGDLRSPTFRPSVDHHYTSSSLVGSTAGLVDEMGEAYFRPRSSEKPKGQALFNCIEAIWFSRRLRSKPVPQIFFKIFFGPSKLFCKTCSHIAAVEGKSRSAH